MDIRTDTKEITEKKIKLEKEIARKMEEFEKETGKLCDVDDNEVFQKEEK